MGLKDLSRHFPNDMEMAIKHIKRCSTPLVIREVQIKSKMIYHFTPIQMVIAKNNQSTRKKQALLRCGEIGILVTAVRM